PAGRGRRKPRTAAPRRVRGLHSSNQWFQQSIVARQYELECGHCGFLFTLEEAALARTVKCAVCGGMLTVAVAVPVALPPAPPPPPAPVPPAPAPKRPVPLPAPPEPEPETGDADREDRARHLRPWM